MTSPVLFRWQKGTALRSRLPSSDEGSDVVFVADMTVQDQFNEPLYIIEVSFSQTRANVVRKISERMFIPSLLGVVLIDFEETPPYQRPKHEPTAKDIVGKGEWDHSANEAPDFGPIIIKENWCGTITCSFDVWFKGDVEPRVSQKVCDYIEHKFNFNSFVL